MTTGSKQPRAEPSAALAPGFGDLQPRGCGAAVSVFGLRLEGGLWLGRAVEPWKSQVQMSQFGGSGGLDWWEPEFEPPVLVQRWKTTKSNHLEGS